MLEEISTSESSSRATLFRIAYSAILHNVMTVLPQEQARALF